MSSPEARRDVLIGGTLLFTLLIGWILNLGHRLDVVQRLHRNQPPYFRGFTPWGRTFLRGLRAFAAIVVYLSPAVGLAALARWARLSGEHSLSLALAMIAAATFLLGVFTLPGGMTYNAVYDDMSYLYRPDKALGAAVRGGRAYLRAWLIALAAIAVSFGGLAVLVIGFFYTSVWAWNVVGYAFSRALVANNTGEWSQPEE